MNNLLKVSSPEKTFDATKSLKHQNSQKMICPSFRVLRDFVLSCFRGILLFFAVTRQFKFNLWEISSHNIV
jgi:hypothetical protein